MRSNLPSMVQSVVRELVLLLEEQEREANEEEEEGDDDDDGDDDGDDDDMAAAGGFAGQGRDDNSADESDYDEDDDVVDEEDQAYLQSLGEKITSERVQRFLGGEVAEADDDDFTTDIISPVQTIDCFSFFFAALEQAGLREPHVYGNIVQTLPPEDQARFQMLFQRMNSSD